MTEPYFVLEDSCPADMRSAEDEAAASATLRPRPDDLPKVRGSLRNTFLIRS